MTGLKTAEEMHRATGGQPIYPVDVKDQISGMSFDEIFQLSEASGVKAEILE